MAHSEANYVAMSRFEQSSWDISHGFLEAALGSLERAAQEHSVPKDRRDLAWDIREMVQNAITAMPEEPS